MRIHLFVLAVLGFVFSVFGGAAFAQERPTPDVTEIVSAHEAFKTDSNKQSRNKLLRALTDYSDDPTTESILAFNDLVSYDVRQQKWKKLRESARAAFVHTESVADIIPKIHNSFGLLSSVALFNAERDSSAILEMAHVQGFARRIHDADQVTDWAKDSYHRADAWIMAMSAYFESRRKRFPQDEEVQAILAIYGADRETLNARARTVETTDDETGEAPLPFCRGGLLQRPALEYPRGAARSGLVGAVIIQISTDEDGKVATAEVLASVPDEGFKEVALRTVKKWKYKADRSEQPSKSCRLNRENMVIPMSFMFD